MPYSSDEKVVYGDDALKPEMWARGVLCEWLTTKLNAEPYASQLGITSERQAFVSDVGALVRARYSAAGSPPVVAVWQGPSDSQTWRKTIDGETFEGKRIEVTLNLDMGVSDANPSLDDPKAEQRDDSLLASFVQDAIECGFDELNELGLFNSNIEADAEKRRMSRGRHPMTLTFFLRTLRNWTP